jgi:hypothetical protein
MQFAFSRLSLKINAASDFLWMKDRHEIEAVVVAGSARMDGSGTWMFLRSG